MRHTRVVALVEIAAGTQRNPKRAEVVRRHEMPIRMRAFAQRRNRAADDRHHRRRLIAGQRHAVGERGGRGARERRESLIELLVERDELLAASNVAAARSGR